MLIHNGNRSKWYVNPSAKERKALSNRIGWYTHYWKHPTLLLMALFLSGALVYSSSPLMSVISTVAFVCIATWTSVLVLQDLLHLKMYRRMKRQNRIIDFGIWSIGFTLVHEVLFSEEDGRGLEYGNWRDVIRHADPTLIDLFLLDSKNLELLAQSGIGKMDPEIRRQLTARAQAILDDIQPYAEAVRENQRHRRQASLIAEREELTANIERERLRLQEIVGETAGVTA